VPTFGYFSSLTPRVFFPSRPTHEALVMETTLRDPKVVDAATELARLIVPLRRTINVQLAVDQIATFRHA